MIIFQTLTFRNILSVGNSPVKINLNNTKTTLVHGLNGSGKSTILDALTYCLFGKSFRGVNLSQLVNTQNKKGLLVECDFKIGNNTFLIRRGMKPRVFEIFKNEEIIDSKAADKDNQAYLEKSILKLSYKSFTQIVILGSSNFIPFMQLNTTGRRECVEDFLDIKVFSVMAENAKVRYKMLKDQYRMGDTDLDAYQFKLEAQLDKIQHMQNNQTQNVEEYKKKIRESEVESRKNTDIMTMINKNLKTEAEILSDYAKTKAPEQVKKLNTVIVKLNSKLDRLVKERDFFEQDECPTCGQGIDYALKTGVQSRVQKEMEEIDKASIQAGQMLLEQENICEDMRQSQLRLTEFKDQIRRLEWQLNLQQEQRDHCQKMIDSIADDSGVLEREQGVYDQMCVEIKEKKEKIELLLDDIRNHEVVTNLLKDSGIKTQIVKKYLPAMNKYIRHYLTELDLPIHFRLNEEFNETVSSPLHQDFSYSSFSEGQKSRIDLCLMFTWREIAKLKNTVSTNLLILDEVFSSSLDETGKENLLQLLRYRLPDNQRVVVVDHTLSGAFKEKFDNNIEVTRINGFSRYS